MLEAGRIETINFKKIFVFGQLVGLDTAAEIVRLYLNLSKPAAYSTNGLLLKQTVR